MGSQRTDYNKYAEDKAKEYVRRNGYDPESVTGNIMLWGYISGFVDGWDAK